MSGDREVRRRWQKLDEEQRALADELVRRALELRELSEDGLSIREALELAADAVQRRGLRAPVPLSKAGSVTLAPAEKPLTISTVSRPAPTARALADESAVSDVVKVAEAKRKASTGGPTAAAGRIGQTATATTADLQSPVPVPVPVTAVEAQPAVWGKGGTHCLYGHLYDEANTYWAHDGGRRCRACKRAHALGRLDRPAVREAARKYNRERGRAIRAGTWVYVRDRVRGDEAGAAPDGQ